MHNAITHKGTAYEHNTCELQNHMHMICPNLHKNVKVPQTTHSLNMLHSRKQKETVCECDTCEFS